MTSQPDPALLPLTLEMAAAAEAEDWPRFYQALRARALCAPADLADLDAPVVAVIEKGMAEVRGELARLAQAGKAAAAYARGRQTAG